MDFSRRMNKSGQELYGTHDYLREWALGDSRHIQQTNLALRIDDANAGDIKSMDRKP